MARIKRYTENEPLDLEWRKEDLKFVCCDCGLVHRIRFAVAGKWLRARARRDNRSTGQCRRYRDIIDISIVERVDTESQALVYAQQVATGAKLAASFMVRPDLVESATAVANGEGCLFLTETGCEWATVWIYKYPFVRLLIEEKRTSNGHDRPSPLDIWSTGKLFGYSDYEIAQYLQVNGYIKSALT